MKNLKYKIDFQEQENIYNIILKSRGRKIDRPKKNQTFNNNSSLFLKQDNQYRIPKGYDKERHLTKKIPNPQKILQLIWMQ